jgi:hypothetical protein
VISIRIFKTREDAEWAKKALEEGGILTTISEDKFNNVPIQEFGVQARFRLNVTDNKDLNRAAQFLAKKLRKAKESNA